MTLDKRLTEVFDRALRDGIDTLNSTDRELYRIQDFIIEYEIGGLSGYIYNRLPDIEFIQSAVTAMRQHGLMDLANLLEQAAALFSEFEEPSPPSTWRIVLECYDPGGQLDILSRRIHDLGNYGIS